MDQVRKEMDLVDLMDILDPYLPVVDLLDGQEVEKHDLLLQVDLDL